MALLDDDAESASSVRLCKLVDDASVVALPDGDERVAHSSAAAGSVDFRDDRVVEVREKSLLPSPRAEEKVRRALALSVRIVSAVAVIFRTVLGPVPPMSMRSRFEMRVISLRL